MEFYTFRHNSSRTRGFTWAMEVVPRSPIVEKYCPECKGRSRMPSGAVDVGVEGGSKWPDVLGCGNDPFMVFSERVVDGWQEAGITSFDTYPVGVASIKSRSALLRETPPPRYFRVIPTGKCEIDLAASGLRVLKSCPVCHRRLETDPHYLHMFVMKPGSWDGSPLFAYREEFPNVVFCTDLVFEVAQQKKLTNFRFRPMQEWTDASFPGIKYM